MTLPNLITFFRLLLIPVFLLVFWSDSQNLLLAMAIFALAGLSDLLDGYLARKLNAISDIGKVLDPIADKGMTAAAVVSLYLDDHMPGWLVLVLLGKEAVMILGGTYLWVRKKQRDLSARIAGKAATFLIFVAVLLNAFNLPGRSTVNVAAAAATLVALIYYCWVFFLPSVSPFFLVHRFKSRR